MTRRELHPDDLVEARVRGERIVAVVEAVDDSTVPERPIRVRTRRRQLTRYLSPRQVEKRLSRPTKQMEIAT